MKVAHAFLVFALFSTHAIASDSVVTPAGVTASTTLDSSSSIEYSFAHLKGRTLQCSYNPWPAPFGASNLATAYGWVDNNGTAHTKIVVSGVVNYQLGYVPTTTVTKGQLAGLTSYYTTAELTPYGLSSFSNYGFSCSDTF